MIIKIKYFSSFVSYLLKKSPATRRGNDTSSALHPHLFIHFSFVAMISMCSDRCCVVFVVTNAARHEKSKQTININNKSGTIEKSVK